MNRETNRFSLVGEGASDGLFDPPACISAKFNAATGFEAVDCFHQAEISLRDQVEDG